jgi:hypothetical protein
MMPPGFSKGDNEEEEVLHNFTRILLAIGRNRGEQQSYNKSL